MRPGGGFIGRQLRDLSAGDPAVVRRKWILALQGAARIAMLPFALLAVLLMRVVRPLVLIRLHHVSASRIGHFAGNTELYLCERRAGLNQGNRAPVDISFFLGEPPNAQLALMWRRVLTIWPSWIVEPVFRVNRRLPGCAVHEVGDNTQFDRDVHNLLETMPPHLSFTAEEIARGEAELRRMGIPEGAEVVCIIGRDSTYLDEMSGHRGAFDYHAHRNVDIRNYSAAAEALAERGCFVLRMGSVVAAPLESPHPRVIDYATSPWRSDFLDVYIGATCLFCLSCGTGFDAVPYVFRRPVAYVNLASVGYWFSFVKDSVGIAKRHRLVAEHRDLGLREICAAGVGFTLRAGDFSDRGIELVENTPAEITAVVLEMYARLKGTWTPEAGDEQLQSRFRGLYPYDALDSTTKRPLHGAPRARWGATALRDNPDWLM